MKVPKFWVNYIGLTEHKLYLKINKQLSVMTSNLKHLPSLICSLRLQRITRIKRLQLQKLTLKNNQFHKG